jgi:predicted alpha-1,2-mannosidase
MSQTRLRLRLRALAVAAAAVSLLGAGLARPGPAAHAAPAADGRLTDLVDPFIGTRNEGNTYPGAAVPFGMVQLSPDTGHNTGYDYSQDHIRGFSAVHLSGVGCGIGGDLPVLPTTGDVTATDDARYAAAYGHDGESASPGSYRVRLTSYGGITAELSATARTGWQRYTFSSTRKANVLLDSGQALHRVTSSSVTVVDDHTVRAAITGSGFCFGTRPYTVYTVTRFDRPFASFGTWRGTDVTPGSRSSRGAGLGGAYVRFDTTGGDRDVVATTAVSYVSAAGAQRNLAAEGGGTFGGTVDAARRAWEERLERVRVQGGGQERRRTFYSALYRAFLAPNVGGDADGRYRGWDGRVHTAKGFTYYQNWSLWDTYRTQQQLLALLAPRESRDMALSLLRVADEGGWLPKWGYGTVETNVMTGDPVTPFLTDAFQQGLLKGHEEEAYRALKRNADRLPPADSPYAGREGAERYAADGFVPQDPALRPPGKPGDSDFEHGGSATLEYALADAALGRMARDLGHRADAERYLARGQYYRNLLDPATRFFRARDRDGLFTGSQDPADSVGFHEGTAWQYMWLVPQDLPDLVRLVGGRQEANRRLDAFFAYDRLVKDPEGTARTVWINGPYDYYNADKYNPQNEPDLLAPYTYLSTGQPWKTTDVVHAALTLFRDAPDGITGNDDLGTMSSWAVLSGIGIYPVVPGSTVWGLSTPVFDRVDLSLDRRYYPGRHLTITAPGTSESNRYIRSVRVGGKAHDATYLTGADVAAGRDVAFSLGGEPSRWGTRPGDAPPAIDRRSPAQHRLSAGVRPAETGVVAGGAGPVELTVSTVFTQPGDVRGRVAVSVPQPLSADPAGSRFTVHSGGLPAVHDVTVRVTVPKDTADGSYPVTVRVSDSRGATVTRTAHIRVVTATCAGKQGFCTQDLTNAYDTDGVSTRDSGQGDFDGTGFSYPAEAMPKAGTGALGGVAYRFPDTTGTAPDFVTARGQTLQLTRRAYAALDLLVAAHHGEAAGTATVTYADGSTARVRLAAADWAAPAPLPGEETAVAAESRYDAKGAPDGVAVRLWHTSLPLDPGKEAVSVTLPDQPRLLVYAVSGHNG